MALALYRKYRPQILGDIVGQETVTTILKNAAAADKAAHAYLFYGPRGTGKTTIARILAKILNCETRVADKNFAKSGEPCNKCHACASIDAGQSLDVIEIDAASNRGIDEIRNLQETVKTLPSLLRRKVVIIDEVHMLTTQAFNALLKTLEEPPGHVVFILATTEYEKVPATIISRTQRFHFRRLTLREIVTKLETIAKKENIAYDMQALEMIAYLADGGMRDAESLFDQIVSMKDAKVTTEHVESVLGKVDFAKVTTMADLIIRKDLPNALEFLYEVNNQGHNIFQFNKDLTEYLRRTLSLSLSPSLEKMFEREMAQAEIAKMKQHAAQLDASYGIAIVKGLIEAYANMRYNPFPIVPFEVAIIENLSKNKSA